MLNVKLVIHHVTSRLLKVNTFILPFSKLNICEVDNSVMYVINVNYYIMVGNRGSTVVKLLCYKSEGLFFDPRWCQWIFL